MKAHLMRFFFYNLVYNEGLKRVKNYKSDSIW
jgi:hypothetical protein